MRGLTAVLITCLILLSGCNNREGPHEFASTIGVGKKAPGFAYPDMDGRVFNLEGERGKVVVLFFWRYRCGVCRDMFRGLKTLKELYKDRPLTIITIDEDTIHSASIYTINRFLKENGYEFRVLRDDGAYLAGLYKTLWTPTVFVVDTEGTIAFISTGERVEFASPEFLSLIDRLLPSETRR